jgi:hypothetical protein
MMSPGIPRTIFLKTRGTSDRRHDRSPDGSQHDVRRPLAGSVLPAGLLRCDAVRAIRDAHSLYKYVTMVKRISLSPEQRISLNTVTLSRCSDPVPWIYAKETYVDDNNPLSASRVAMDWLVFADACYAFSLEQWILWLVHISRLGATHDRLARQVRHHGPSTHFRHPHVGSLCPAPPLERFNWLTGQRERVLVHSSSRSASSLSSSSPSERVAYRFESDLCHLPESERSTWILAQDRSASHVLIFLLLTSSLGVAVGRQGTPISVGARFDSIDSGGSGIATTSDVDASTDLPCSHPPPVGVGDTRNPLQVDDRKLAPEQKRQRAASDDIVFIPPPWESDRTDCEQGPSVERFWGSEGNINLQGKVDFHPSGIKKHSTATLETVVSDWPTEAKPEEQTASDLPRFKAPRMLSTSCTSRTKPRHIISAKYKTHARQPHVPRLIVVHHTQFRPRRSPGVSIYIPEALIEELHSHSPLSWDPQQHCVFPPALARAREGKGTDEGATEPAKRPSRGSTFTF